MKDFYTLHRSHHTTGLSKYDEVQTQNQIMSLFGILLTSNNSMATWSLNRFALHNTFLMPIHFHCSPNSDNYKEACLNIVKCSHWSWVSPSMQISLYYLSPCWRHSHILSVHFCGTHIFLRISMSCCVQLWFWVTPF